MCALQKYFEMCVEEVVHFNYVQEYIYTMSNQTECFLIKVDDTSNLLHFPCIFYNIYVFFLQ